MIYYRDGLPWIIINIQILSFHNSRSKGLSASMIQLNSNDTLIDVKTRRATKKLYFYDRKIKPYPSKIVVMLANMTCSQSINKWTPLLTYKQHFMNTYYFC